VLSPSSGAETVAFHGPYQAGITTPAQSHLSLVGLDLREGWTPDDLTRLLRVLGDDVARLARGDGALADTEPELAADPARLTVTFGIGPDVVATLRRTAQLPELAPLPAFSTDRLRPAWGQTDLVLQVCSDDPVTVAHARRVLGKDSRSFATVTWVQDGFRRARGSEAAGTTMRNVMGQIDGTVNPAEAEPDFAPLVWKDGPGAWSGATCMVVRRIEALMDTWDKVGREGRELAVGRRLDNGAPLTSAHEFDEPDFEATDPVTGLTVIDAASHIRRARSDDKSQRFLRRSYNYTVTDAQGRDESGLVFIAFAADVDRQFVPVQRRLAEQDRLNEWVTTIGSSVYLLLPGVPEGGVLGDGLWST
jgi:dye decolorizing peroxidase